MKELTPAELTQAARTVHPRATVKSIPGVSWWIERPTVTAEEQHVYGDTLHVHLGGTYRAAVRFLRTVHGVQVES